MKKQYSSVRFGENLRELRERANMTQEELSKELRDYGTSLSTKMIGKYENGYKEAVIGADKLYALSQILGVSIDYLLSNEIEMSTDNNVKELGLKIETIKKIKQIKKKEERAKSKVPETGEIFKVPEPLAYISEIDVLNRIITDSKVIDVFTEQAKEYIESHLELYRKAEIIKEGKVEVDETLTMLKCKNTDNLYMAKSKVNIEIEKLFKKYVNTQLKKMQEESKNRTTKKTKTTTKNDNK